MSSYISIYPRMPCCELCVFAISVPCLAIIRISNRESFEGYLQSAQEEPKSAVKVILFSAELNRALIDGICKLVLGG
jgi:hypothetical protein